MALAWGPSQYGERIRQVRLPLRRQGAVTLLVWPYQLGSRWVMQVYACDREMAMGVAPTTEAAQAAAEAALRDLLRPAVEALGGTLPEGEGGENG